MLVSTDLITDTKQECWLLFCTSAQCSSLLILVAVIPDSIIYLLSPILKMNYKGFWGWKERFNQSLNGGGIVTSPIKDHLNQVSQNWFYVHFNGELLMRWWTEQTALYHTFRCLEGLKNIWKEVNRLIQILSIILLTEIEEKIWENREKSILGRIGEAGIILWVLTTHAVHWLMEWQPPTIAAFHFFHILFYFFTFFFIFYSFFSIKRMIDGVTASNHHCSFSFYATHHCVAPCLKHINISHLGFWQIMN